MLRPLWATSRSPHSSSMGTVSVASTKSSTSERRALRRWVPTLPLDLLSCVRHLRAAPSPRLGMSAPRELAFLPAHTRAGVVCDITTCLSFLCHSLYRNDICDNGVKSLAAVLKNTKITRLKCATLIAPPCIFIARPMTVLVLLSASQTTSWGR